MSANRRGDATKTVLIVLGGLFTLMMCVCMGVGVAGYFWFQKNLARVAVTDPAVIREMTGEVIDITIPAEFVPQFGTSLMQMTTVSYRWCPTGNCPPLGTSVGSDDFEGETPGHLNLIGFGETEPSDTDITIETFTENFGSRFEDLKVETRDYTIAGKTCKFFFARGVERPNAWTDDDDDMDGSTPDVVAGSTEPAADPMANPQAAGPRVVFVEGAFPGKKGSMMLNLYMLEQDYDDAQIDAMLKSIR